jgi:hypothetical protein
LSRHSRSTASLSPTAVAYHRLPTHEPPSPIHVVDDSLPQIAITPPSDDEMSMMQGRSTLIVPADWERRKSHALRRKSTAPHIHSPGHQHNRRRSKESSFSYDQVHYLVEEEFTMPLRPRTLSHSPAADNNDNELFDALVSPIKRVERKRKHSRLHRVKSLASITCFRL